MTDVNLEVQSTPQDMSDICQLLNTDWPKSKDFSGAVVSRLDY